MSCNVPSSLTSAIGVTESGPMSFWNQLIQDVFGGCNWESDHNELVLTRSVLHGGSPDSNAGSPGAIFHVDAKSSGLADMSQKAPGVRPKVCGCTGDVDGEVIFSDGDVTLKKNKRGELGQELDVLVLMSDIMNLHHELLAENGWKLKHLNDAHYSINGRKVLITSPSSNISPEWAHLSSKLGPGTARMASTLMVHDGPLEQPLFDYLMQTGLNEHYDTRGTENPGAVTGVARALDFAVPQTALCDRIDAMRHAKAQADVRHSTSEAELERFTEAVKNDLETVKNNAATMGPKLDRRTRTSSGENLMGRTSSCERTGRASSCEGTARTSSCERSGSVTSKLRNGPSRYAKGRVEALGGA